MIIFGISGILVISYALWVKKEGRQDILFLIGGLLLLLYSMSIGDPVFIVLQVVFILSALTEFLKLHRKT